MSQILPQASFNSGEWAPALAARVDIAKYHSGAALLENFFVDYRGGASTRPGTVYINQAYKSSTAVRLIPFQGAFNEGYILEFGDGYIRFFYQAQAVLEDSFAVSAATQANPCVITVTSNNFAVGDWIYISDVVGMTELNGGYYSVAAVSGSSVTLSDVNGNSINSSSFPAYISGGTAARVYTLAAPYAAADLSLIKFSQSAGQMILCHPNYSPQVLTLITATNWTITPIVIGTSISPPTGVVATTTLSSGSVNQSYVVTSLDTKGQESEPCSPVSLTNIQDIRTTAGTNIITWTAAQGAVGYNVYESDVSYYGVIPFGVQYGFIGTCTGTSFVDSNIAPDYSQSPPIAKNPFLGYGIESVAVVGVVTYTEVPTVSFSGGAPVIPAQAYATLSISSIGTFNSGAGFKVGDLVVFQYSVVMKVTSINNTTDGGITGMSIVSPGSVSVGTPDATLGMVSTSGGGVGPVAMNVTWFLSSVVVTASGAGYGSVPAVVFSTGSGAATATLQAAGNGNPSVPSFFQERLILAAQPGAPETFFASQSGLYFNFNISSPIEDDDAITATLVSGSLNTIKSIVSSTAGMLILSDQAAWLVNGGSSGSAITPISTVANAQSFIGASDVPPIVANYDVLYVQSKGSGIRDLSYNIYFNLFTGSDISIISSHLFFGYEILQWTWAEQPFYVVWAVRNDGVMLSLTLLKEQDFIAWAHHKTTNGTFESVASVVEETSTAGVVDAVYTVVKRTINGNVVQYIERIADRIFPNGVEDAWAVDAGIQYIGSPTTNFSGGQHLAGQTVTGLADGNVITPFIMPIDGNFILPAAASKVTVGIGYTCDLQTLPIDLGDPSIQGKVKKIPFVDVRVANTLGLSIGNDFNSLVPMKDLIVGNVSSMLTGQPTQIISGLVDGDARTYLSPAYTVPGQYCIRQSQPLPASVLGVFPAYVIGDDA